MNEKPKMAEKSNVEGKSKENQISKLSLTSIDSLKFLGEGNEHIVYEVVDTNNVLRLRKFPPDDQTKENELLDLLKLDVEFNNLFRQLAGPMFLDQSSVVRADLDILDRAVERDRNVREGKRLSKQLNRYGFGILTANVTSQFIDRLKTYEETSSDDTGNMSKKCALKAETGAENEELICIELKAKQAFCEIGPKYSKLCRFCIKQFWKVEDNIEKQRSSYCPQQLFSGDGNLMREALKSLFQNPQNNLKIFSDGQRKSKVNEYSHMIDLLISILTYNPIQSHDSSSDESMKFHEDVLPKTTLMKDNDNLDKEMETKETDKTVDNSTKDEFRTEFLLKELRSHHSDFKSKLAAGSILGKLLSLQSFGYIHEVHAAAMFQVLIDQYSKCYDKLFQRITDFQAFVDAEFGEEDKTDKFRRQILELEAALTILQVAKSEKKLKILDSKYPSVDSEGETVESKICTPLMYSSKLEPEILKHLVQKCLISMSAKDCSIMILMQGPFEKNPKAAEKMNDHIGSPFYISQNEKWYKCQISLVDIALKDPQKILGHEKQMKKYEETLERLIRENQKPNCCSTQIIS